MAPYFPIPPCGNRISQQLRTTVVQVIGLVTLAIGLANALDTDNIVFPPRAATMAGADIRYLRATAHMAMAFHPQVVAEVARRIGGGDAVA